MAAIYREQYDRMRRWYQKFVTLDQGRLHDVSSDNYVDDIYAFFMNYYHLKDWIRNDNKVAASVRKAVEPYVGSNRCLKLCGDICNSLKHLRLKPKKKQRSGESPAFGKKQFRLDLGTTTIDLKYEVNTTTGPIDAFQLATECVDAWDTFLRDNRLT
jgi:hypothetical protein